MRLIDYSSHTEVNTLEPRAIVRINMSIEDYQDKRATMSEEEFAKYIGEMFIKCLDSHV